MPDKVTCYFSFRSPYSWLALHRLEKIIGDLAVQIDYIPIFPPPGRRTLAENDTRKMAYILQDITRFAGAYGLAVQMPDPFDIDWRIPHSAFLFADDAGNGLSFCNSLYRLRFSEGADISLPDVLKRSAGECGLDAEAVASAGLDEAFHERVMYDMANLGETNVFGVPTFLYNDQQFWGNDRLDWLIRAIYREQGRKVPDLGSDPLARPF